jgi:hypothetical protein
MIVDSRNTFSRSAIVSVSADLKAHGLSLRQQEELVTRGCGQLSYTP